MASGSESLRVGEKRGAGSQRNGRRRGCRRYIEGKDGEAVAGDCGEVQLREICAAGTAGSRRRAAGVGRERPKAVVAGKKWERAKVTTRRTYL